MSSASIPAPSRGTSPSGSRSNYFWPLLIFFLGAGTLAFYQVESLNGQLAEVTSAADRMDPQVKLAQYQKAKFYAMARDLLRMAPTHPGAAKLVDELNLRKLAAAQPVLMSLTQPSGFTNTAPTLPPPPSAPKTNAAPSALIQ
jgi:hypothetical protein